MNNAQPIACSLPKGDQTDRATLIAEIASRGMTGISADPHRATLRFRGDPDTVAQVRALIEAERECCPFFEFREPAGDEGFVLEIGAPEGAEQAIGDLVAGSSAGWRAP